MRTNLSTCSITQHTPNLEIGYERQGFTKAHDQFQFGGEIWQALKAWEKRLLQIVECNVIKLAAQL